MHPPMQQPDEWQSAYTKDQAYRDSGSRIILFVLTVGLALVYTLLFITFHLRMVVVTSMPQDLVWLAYAIFLMVVALILFFVGQRQLFRSAAHFLQEFYLPPESVEPGKIIAYRLIGRPPLPPPLNMLFKFKKVLIKDGEIEKSDHWTGWMTRHLGGPVQLVISDGCALYLERGNQFSRIIGPGEHPPFLELNETIKVVVDYRPKVKTGEMKIWTKNGIRIKISVRMECQIGAPRQSAQSPLVAAPDALPDSQPIASTAENSLAALSHVYPFDPVAIQKAVERCAVSREVPTDAPVEKDWVDTAWGQVTGIVPNYLGGRTLDDLILSDRKSNQIFSPKANEELHTSISAATEAFGVFINSFQVTSLELPSEVEKQARRNWEAERESASTLISGKTTAYNIRTREEARADAQRKLILAIAEGLELNKNQNYNEPLLLSLSSVLDGSLKDPLARAYLAKETLDSLEKLQKLLGDSAVKPAKE